MPYAWNRSEHSDGHFLPFHELSLKGYNRCSLLWGFKRRSAEEARHLIEDLAKCNYKAQSEASGSSSILKRSGVIELNWMTAIEAKLDALMNKLGNNERRMHTALEVGSVDKGGKRKSADEGLIRIRTQRVFLNQTIFIT